MSKREDIDYISVEPSEIEDLVYNKLAIVEVTKELTFDSCHQLKEYLGACARLHGHTYKLQVTIEGELDYKGMVIDFKELNKYLKEELVSDLDHYNLNEKFFFNTTAENMVVYFFELISKYITTISNTVNRYLAVKEVKLWETPTSFASYKGVTRR